KPHRSQRLRATQSQRSHAMHRAFFMNGPDPDQAEPQPGVSLAEIKLSQDTAEPRGRRAKLRSGASRAAPPCPQRAIPPGTPPGRLRLSHLPWTFMKNAALTTGATVFRGVAPTFSTALFVNVNERWLKRRRDRGEDPLGAGCRYHLSGGDQAG